MSSAMSLPFALALLGQAPAPDEAAFSAQAPARLAFMKASVLGYDIRPAAGSTAPFVLQQEPVLRFTNPVGRSRDGTVFLWFDDQGRPATVVQASLNRRNLWVHEFSSLSARPLVAKSSRGVAWSPTVGGVEFHAVPEAPRPADSAETRLIQMRALARDFAVEDHFQQMSWQGLRLLPKPSARYGKPGSDTRDGALFAYVLTTDPEAYLLLEARGGDNGPVWMYAFAPSTTYSLRATWKGKEVWTRNTDAAERSPNDTIHQVFYEEP